MRRYTQIAKKTVNSLGRMSGKQIVYCIPLVLLIFLILFKNQLIELHDLFSLFLIAMQFVVLFVTLFYLLGLVVKKSIFTLLLAVIAVCVFLLKYTDTFLSLNYNKEIDERTLTVMTWNLQRLGTLKHLQDNSKNIKKVLKSLKDNNVNVAIFQEISLQQTQSIVQQLKLKTNDFIWTDYYGPHRLSKGGIAIIAIDNKNLKLASKSSPLLPPNWQCAYVDLVIKDKKHINIIGVHIAPLKISENEVKSAVKSMFTTPQKAIGMLKNNARRFSSQFKKQEEQTQRINEILLRFKDPTIIAGDFNSTPEFPLHKKLSSQLTDAWLVSGNGWGFTRNWLGFIPMRIDYIYLTKQLKVSQTKTLSSKFSDHNPIVSTIIY